MQLTLKTFTLRINTKSSAAAILALFYCLGVGAA